MGYLFKICYLPAYKSSSSETCILEGRKVNLQGRQRDQVDGRERDQGKGRERELIGVGRRGKELRGVDLEEGK